MLVFGGVGSESFRLFRFRGSDSTIERLEEMNGQLPGKTRIHSYTVRAKFHL